MARIIDLTDGGSDADILTSTGSDGLLGGQYLHDKPLADWLWESEEPKYVLRNKKRGVEIEEEGDERALTPGEDYQTLAAVTDVRVVFLVGSESGDEFRNVQLRDVVQAKAESEGFRESALVIETLNDVRYRFPCRGDVSEVAAATDDAASTWGAVERRLEDAEMAIEASLARTDAGEHDAAVEKLDGVAANIEAAGDLVTPVGPGAIESVTEHIDALRVRYDRARRRVYGERGAHHHAAAQDAWDELAYEDAADHYEQAIRDYEEAVESSGPEPTDESLARRIEGAVRERIVLTTAPLMDADTARRRAAGMEGPAEAADVWETALERYRNALELEWGSEDRRFRVDKETVRERAAAVADGAIDAHRDAGDKWLRSGDTLAVDGREERAEQVYEQAREHVERAFRLAREVRPEQTDALEDELETIEERLSGDGIPDEMPDRVLSAEDFEGVAASETTAGEDDEASRDPGPDAESEAATGPDTPPDTGSDVATDTSPDAELEAASGDVETEAESTETATGGGTEAAVPTATGEHGPDDSNAEEGPSRAAIKAAIRDQDDELFTELVAAAWERRGWSTTVFAASAGAVYDIVAVREGTTDERLLLWTIHNPDGGLPATAVERCATARDSGQGAAAATLVTSGTLTSAAADLAADLDVTVVDGDEFATILRETGLYQQLDL